MEKPVKAGESPTPPNTPPQQNAENALRQSPSVDHGSGDGIKEPLLDVSTFDPKLVGETEPEPGENVAPTANFTFDATGLTATFTDTSSDSDGSIVSRAWAFGDGGTASTQNPSHTYATAGTYTVTLTVKDDDGAIGTTSQSVTVSTTVSPEPLGLLSVTARSAGANRYADLEWTGGSTANVDIYRNTTKVATTLNDGVYTDTAPKKTSSATYQVCEAGTNVCSNSVTATW